MAPCKDCQDREPGCHGKCEKYKEFREALDKENAKRKEEICIDATIDRLLFNRLKKYRRERKKKE